MLSVARAGSPPIMIITGIVSDGHGAAKRDVSNGFYSSVSPALYPGTLNIRTPDSPWKLPLPAKQLIDHNDARCLIWDATLHIPVGYYVRVWAMWPQHRTVSAWNIIEILSEFPLRSTYGLTTGMEVEVELCPVIPTR
jgi:CTP-dependent riboflavin kinase